MDPTAEQKAWLEGMERLAQEQPMQTWSLLTALLEQYALKVHGETGMPPDEAARLVTAGRRIAQAALGEWKRSEAPALSMLWALSLLAAALESLLQTPDAQSQAPRALREDKPRAPRRRRRA
jgi:hypothetical protein